MGFKTNLSGVQFAELPEGYIPCGNIHVEHEAPFTDEKGNTYDSPVGVYDESGMRIGYLPEKSKLKYGNEIKKIAYEASVLGTQLVGTIKEGKWKDNGEWNNEGRGELLGIDVVLEWPYGNNVSSTHYTKSDKKYQRLTGLLGRIEWEKGKYDKLDGWKISCHRTYDDYKQAMAYYAMDGSLLHEKAEILANGGTLPDNIEFPERVQHFLDALKPEFINTENTVYDDELGIAGTYDGLAIINGKKTILDWKRGKYYSEQYYFQMAFYAINAGAEQAMVVPFGMQKFRPSDIPIIDIDEIKLRYEAVKHMKAMLDIADGLAT